MSTVLEKDEIIMQLANISGEMTRYCAGVEESLFFIQPAEKWSIAENIRHLITSANTTRLAFSLPRFLIRVYAGKPNRNSRDYNELVAKYNLALAQGGKASGRYIPKRSAEPENKQKLLSKFSGAMDKLINSIQKNWNDPQLDKYIVPHPLLGKITLRELGYFTIFHTEHHLTTIKSRM